MSDKKPDDALKDEEGEGERAGARGTTRRYFLRASAAAVAASALPGCTSDAPMTSHSPASQPTRSIISSW